MKSPFMNQNWKSMKNVQWINNLKKARKDELKKEPRRFEISIGLKK